MKIATGVLLVGTLSAATAFTPALQPQTTSATSSASLHMGLFDGFGGWGTGANEEALDEQWRLQQEMLANRRDPTKKKAYFDKLEEDRIVASRKQKEMWAWQTKKYKKGEDPIDEWRKRRADGSISDLENQYGDPKKIGGIPLPGASFGVGGEFGVGYVCFVVLPCCRGLQSIVERSILGVVSRCSLVHVLLTTMLLHSGKYDNGGRFE